MSDEKMRILKLLEDKKISSAEAMALLEALDKSGGAAAPGSARVLRIRVYEGGAKEPKVNVNVPLGWAKFMAPFIEGKIKAKLADKGYNVDLAKIQEAIEAQEPMKIVDVQDGNDKVEIYIE
ncbi:MAG TPA: hypothetical protein DCZ92_10725 [Elusimicrobia bacterium]|nr:MAG: hypothetical protein A2016_04415 [Elusimicrobia bacterium GWF2_62_30]HBA61268.1 hypothetical protein [Elusimicrobiota bacterium]